MSVCVDILGRMNMRMSCGLQEKPEGKIAELWGGKLSESGLATIDVSAGLANVFAPKDKDELQNIRRSAFLSATVMRAFAVPTLESELPFWQSSMSSHLMLQLQTGNIQYLTRLLLHPTEQAMRPLLAVFHAVCGFTIPHDGCRTIVRETEMIQSWMVTCKACRSDGRETSKLPVGL